jgi:hypothetical protein
MTSASASVRRDSRETRKWPRDPLLYHLDFPFRSSFSPLGFPMHICSNSPTVITVARQTWGAFPALFSAEPIHLQVGVSETGSELPRPPVLRAHRGIVTVISDALNFAVCDVTAGFSFGWFTPAVISDADFFRYHFLDLMAGLLLAPIHFAIVHAACVLYRGSGFLLCGHSGAGKSTLAYACSQRGWTFISDDAGYVPLRSPSRAVVGNPLFLRLRDNAPELFPQLQDRSVILRQNGEFGFELPTETLPGMNRAFQANIDHIVFLDRRPSGAARLLPHSTEDARLRLENVLDYTLACKGPDITGGNTEKALTNSEVRQRQKAAVSELLTAYVHELTYSAFDEAIDCLEELAKGTENTMNR